MSNIANQFKSIITESTKNIQINYNKNVYDIQNKIRIMESNKREFIMNIPEILFREAVYHLIENLSIVKNNQKVTKAAIDTFMEDNNVYKISRNTEITMATQTIIETINKFTDKFIEEFDPSENVVDDNIKKEFLNELDGKEDYQSIKDIIKNKVVDAEEKFLTDNKEAKEEIENIIDDTNNRIKELDNDDVMTESTRNSIINRLNRERDSMIDAINRNNKTLLGALFVEGSKKIMNNKDNRDYIITEGSIDMEKVTNYVAPYYVVLETFNTMRIIKVDKKYIEKNILQ